MSYLGRPFGESYLLADQTVKIQTSAFQSFKINCLLCKTILHYFYSYQRLNASQCIRRKINIRTNVHYHIICIVYESHLYSLVKNRLFWTAYMRCWYIRWGTKCDGPSLGIASGVGIEWFVCSQVTFSRQNLLCRAELIAWRLRCHIMGIAERTKILLW